MLQPLQIQDVSTRYSNEIAELREFLYKCGLTLDTPETLHSITERLWQDRAFCRDLTSHAWVVVHGGGPAVRPADLLAMLAIAAAGPRLAAEAGDTEAHDLLRFVMQVWNSFGVAATAASAASPAFSAPFVSRAFTPRVPTQQEPSLSLELPEDSSNYRLFVAVGAAACVLLVLLVGLFMHHHAPASSAPVTTATAAPAGATPSQVQDSSDAAPAARQQQETTRFSARTASRPAPYSRLPESSNDLPLAVAATHTKPAPGTPMTAAPHAVATSKPLPHSRPAPVVRSTPAATDASAHVPNVVPVRSLGVRGAPASAGTTRQAIVRPTSLGIMAANVTYSPAPKYPETAAAERVQGEVKLEAEVGRDGTVESTRIISGPPLLADAAADAVQHWRYRPYLYEGKPVAMNAQIVMDFQLP
jgi:TonB family protein